MIKYAIIVLAVIAVPKLLRRIAWGAVPVGEPSVTTEGETFRCCLAHVLTLGIAAAFFAWGAICATWYAEHRDGIVGGFFLIVCLAMASVGAFLVKSHVAINTNDVTVKWGWLRPKGCPRTSIKHVTENEYSVVVQMDTGARLEIPIVFKNMGRLVAMLRP